MLTLDSKAKLRQALAPWRPDQTIALVPTMGALHRGHQALVEKAKLLADRVVVSIFVNPMQFGPAEDLDRYPRTLEQDQVLLEKSGCDVLYVPRLNQMYDDGMQSAVEPGSLAQGFCGTSRPGHFRGVCTVVLKLLQQVTPNLVLFGRKDAQQLRVLQQMTKDFDLNVEIVPVDTVRESDGLALSSRNRFLDSRQREQSLVLYKALQAGRKAYDAGQRNTEALRQTMAEVTQGDSGVQVEYLDAVQWHDFKPTDHLVPPILLLGAVQVGTTRLIDNIYITDPHVETTPCI